MTIVSSLGRKCNFGRWFLAPSISHPRDPMTRLRFTLAQLMAIMVYLGFSFAALRNADPFWASATYTLAIMMIAAALLGGFIRKGRARTAWIGFAVFGWVYLLIDVLPPRASGGLGFGP